MKKKKLLLIVECMEGGVRRHVMDLLHGLDKECYAITVIYGERADSIFLKQIGAISQYAELIELKTLGREIDAVKDMKSLISIWKTMHQFKPDIVHCHSSKAGVLGRVAAKSLRISKVFYTPHAYSFQSEEFSGVKKKLFITIEKVLSKQSTTFTFNVSQEEKEDAMRFKIDKQDKFKVIYNGLPEVILPDKMLIRRELGVPEYGFIIGNNARLTEQKNPMAFMSIAKRVIAENANIHFVYVGEGPLLKACTDFIDQNDLSDNIHLLGFREDADRIVIAYDMFLITSRFEGLPYSLLESLRARVPILAYAVTGIKEIVTDEIGSLISDEQEASELILKNSDHMTFSKDLIYSKFLTTFSLDTMINNIQAMYMS